MTNQQAYKNMLLEKQCSIERDRCDHRCKDCPSHVTNFAETADFIISVLKARDPALYFLDDFTELHRLIEERLNANQNSEIK